MFQSGCKKEPGCHLGLAVHLTDLSNSGHSFLKPQTENSLISLSRKNRKLFVKQVCAVLQKIPIRVSKLDSMSSVSALLHMWMRNPFSSKEAFQLSLDHCFL